MTIDTGHVVQVLLYYAYRIFKLNPDLWTLYGSLELSQNHNKLKDRQVEFLLWFAVFGRATHSQVAKFGPEYLAFLAHDNGSGSATLLSSYVNSFEQGAPASQVHIESAKRVFAPLLRSTHSKMELKGVSIIGFTRSTVGISEDVRTLLFVLESLNVCVDLVDVTPGGLSDRPEYAALSLRTHQSPMFNIIVFCVPFFEVPRIRSEISPFSLQHSYLIGYFPWELTCVKPFWYRTISEFDEIWSSSNYTRNTFASLNLKPTFLVPLLVQIVDRDLTIATRLNLPSGFMVLSFVDFTSFVTRKNTAASIESFKRAFPNKDDQACLVIKAVHSDLDPSGMDLLLSLVCGDERIVIINGPLTKSETLGIIERSDIFLSLHRAEGFGRVIGEAMLLGTIVVATDWSGSKDLISSATGFPVDFSEVVVSDKDYVDGGGVWADPNVEHAASLIRSIYDNPHRCALIRDNAKTHVHERFSIEGVSPIVDIRIQAAMKFIESQVD